MGMDLDLEEEHEAIALEEESLKTKTQWLPRRPFPTRLNSPEGPGSQRCQSRPLPPFQFKFLIIRCDFGLIFFFSY